MTSALCFIGGYKNEILANVFAYGLCMDELLSQLEKSIDDGHYYLALFVSLAIPDICGALGSKDGKAKGAHYKAWFDKYVAPQYAGNLDGNGCYAFRCSALHQGYAKHKDLGYERILFLDPSSSGGVVMHNNILNNALNIDVGRFCKDVVAGARQWLCNMASNCDFNRNYANFLKRYEGGLLPYIDGLDVFS